MKTRLIPTKQIFNGKQVIVKSIGFHRQLNFARTLRHGTQVRAQHGKP
jgi:hypothetical protein